MKKRRFDQHLDDADAQKIIETGELHSDSAQDSPSDSGGEKPEKKDGKKTGKKTVYILLGVLAAVCAALSVFWVWRTADTETVADTVLEDDAAYTAQDATDQIGQSYLIDFGTFSQLSDSEWGVPVTVTNLTESPMSILVSVTAAKPSGEGEDVISFDGVVFMDIEPGASLSENAFVTQDAEAASAFDGAAFACDYASILTD